jgi:uncharacterized protein
VPPGKWIKKPFRSGGGIGIHRFIKNPGDTQADIVIQPTHYLQRVIPGTPISAIFIGAGGAATFLGATQQLVGCDWAGGEDYLFVGNIGPLPVSTVVESTLRKVGGCIAEQFRLTGLFGMDAILFNEEVWTLEVNPRYTAAVEILERASNLHAIRLHVEACQSNRAPRIDLSREAKFYGKAILHARCPLTIDERFGEWVNRINRESLNEVVADIPNPGIQLKRRQSVCTVFASASTVGEVEVALRNLSARAYAVLEHR